MPDSKSASLLMPKRWQNYIDRYRHAPLSLSEHSLIHDLLGGSKWFALSLFVLFAIGLYAAWGHVPLFWIGLFVTAFILEAIIKVVTANRFKRLSFDEQRQPRWRMIYDLGSGYSGVVYGLAGLVMFVPMPFYNKVLLVGVFSAMVCSVATMTAFFQPVSRWIIPTLVLPTLVVLLLSSNPYFWLLGVVVIIATVGALKLSELSQRRYAHLSKLNEQNEQLINDYSEQQRDAEQQRAIAEQAVIDKSRFIATASHDLRQPLHALGLFHHALRHKSENDDNKELFSSIHKSTTALNAMFDSLLDVSRLDANVVEPALESVMLQDILVLLDQEFIPAAEEKGLYFECSVEPVRVYTDQTLFLRILRNLLSNAIKFTQEGGVSIDAQTVGDKLVIDVMDTGPGIPADERDNVFYEFYQLSAAERKGSIGVGLGLSIVKRLCTLLNMELQLHTAPTGGTLVRLSAESSEWVIDSDLTSTGAHVSNYDESDLAGLTIVFIDDNDDILLGMHTLLDHWHCQVVCVKSGAEALAQLSEQRCIPDLVIADYQLAESSNGIDAIRQIRNAYDERLPGILVCGASSPEDLLDIEASEFPCLTKPVSPDRLRETITGILVPAIESPEPVT